MRNITSQWRQIMSCFNQVILRNIRHHKCVNPCTFGRNVSTLVEEASHWKPEAYHWELRETSPKSNVQISVVLFKTNIVPLLL